MTKTEIATYVGLANILLATAENSMDEEDTEYTSKIREALCQAQLILTQQAIEEFIGIPEIVENDYNELTNKPKIEPAAKLEKEKMKEVNAIKEKWRVDNG